MPYKRLPNGFGNVSKLPGNRRRPYRARKRVGEINGRPIYSTIGYFETREEALRQLALTNDTTLVKDERITFGQCYDLWKQEYGLLKEFPKSYRWAEPYIEPLRKRKIADLKAIDLEAVVNSPKVPRTIKRDCVVLLHGVFGYALRHEIIDRDYSTIAKYAIDHKPQIERRLFTVEEIDALWKRYQNYDKFTLVLLYTGMRVSELAQLEKKNVYIDKGYMVGGMKTDAGKNRIIPIHPTINELIKAQMSDTKSAYVFHTRSGQPIHRANYAKWLNEVADHSPHETRHTFITQAYKCGIAESDIKRIVGHALPGVTQSVYVHADPDYLSDELSKLYY